MKHTILRKPILWILSVILLFPVTNAIAQEDHEKDFEKYEAYLYEIAEYQLDYPDLLFDYNYTPNGEIASVSITGVKDQEKSDHLEKVLIELNDVSDQLLYAKDNNGIYYRAEERARFKDGQEALYSSLKEYLIYPESAIDRNIEGIVQLRFTVDRMGNVKNLTARENIDGSDWIVEEMVKEAKNAFNQIDQDWIPGEIDNVEVAQWVVIPIYFKVEPYPDMLPRM
jgi:hypothetical protein